MGWVEWRSGAGSVGVIQQRLAFLLPRRCPALHIPGDPTLSCLQPSARAALPLTLALLATVLDFKTSGTVCLWLADRAAFCLSPW